MPHKTCRRHRSRISSAGVKLSFPPPLLSAPVCSHCNKLPWSAAACKPLCERMRCLRIPAPTAVVQRTGASACERAAPFLAWVGARLTVAHKRINPLHKDSVQLLSLTTSTKEVTFVCLSGRRRCGRAVLEEEEEEVALVVGLQ